MANDNGTSPPHRHAPRGRIKANPMEQSDPKGRITCTATNRQGKRCGKPPIPGGGVCRLHGGSAPQVQAKAEERLAALYFPAVVRLGELIAQKEYPSVAIAAVKDALDRNRGKAIEQQILEHRGGITITHELPE